MPVEFGKPFVTTFELVAAALQRAGASEREVRAVFGGTAARVYGLALAEEPSAPWKLPPLLASSSTSASSGSSPPMKRQATGAQEWMWTQGGLMLVRRA